jgi:hypothetical protein
VALPSGAALAPPVVLPAAAPAAPSNAPVVALPLASPVAAPAVPQPGMLTEETAELCAAKQRPEDMECERAVRYLEGTGDSLEEVRSDRRRNAEASPGRALTALPGSGQRNEATAGHKCDCVAVERDTSELDEGVLGVQARKVEEGEEMAVPVHVKSFPAVTRSYWETDWTRCMHGDRPRMAEASRAN